MSADVRREGEEPVSRIVLPSNYGNWPKGHQFCGAEFVRSEIEYAPEPSPYGGVTFCELPKGHRGPHVDDSAAGRIAWMTPEEVDAEIRRAPSPSSEHPPRDSAEYEWHRETCDVCYGRELKESAGDRNNSSPPTEPVELRDGAAASAEDCGTSPSSGECVHYSRWNPERGRVECSRCGATL